VTWAVGVTGVAGDDIAAGAFFQVDGAGTARDVTVDGTGDAIQAAIETKDSFRAELGYKMNRLEAAAAVLAVQSENLSAAESRISDVDVATEMSQMTRSQVLAQAGISMLAQANSMPQMALQLLQ
ncbi:MAG: flagellin, partial [Acidobacteria bacterium]|nr:flagellin [Acidobacteriota bacterium]